MVWDEKQSLDCSYTSVFKGASKKNSFKLKKKSQTEKYKLTKGYFFTNFIFLVVINRIKQYLILRGTPILNELEGGDLISGQQTIRLIG